MTSRSNVLHDRERGGTLAEMGAFFQQHLLESANCEFLQILRLYEISKIESGSLTQKDGAIFSLTARDLENHKMILFSTNRRGPVGFVLTQRYSSSVGCCC